MAEAAGIENVVARIVSKVLEEHLPRLREDLVRQVVEELRPHLEQAQPAAAPSHAPTDLLRAVSLVHAGNTQKEILRALLDGTADYSGRAALFVVKSGTATGWQGRAFANNDDIKDFMLDLSAGMAARALQTRTALTGSASDVDPQFISLFGAPAGEAMVLPLLLKDKIAALVYADTGEEAGRQLDSASLEILVAATSAWLEVISLRKQAQKESVAEPAPVEQESAPAMPAAASYSDPFAAREPRHAAPAAPPVAEPIPVHAPAAQATAVAMPDNLSSEAAETHHKAQRFARLLVDEIKLYNQVKVNEGRKNRDLYDRLKDDIEKGRVTYQKRYGNTAAASADYFNHELVRSLAEDDGSLMGANFRR